MGNLLWESCPALSAKNTEIELIFEGEDEDLAADALAELVESGFGE